MEMILWALVLHEMIWLLGLRPKNYGKRLWNILIAIDQLGNAIIGGDPDETISRRAARFSHIKGWYILGKFLDAIDPDHMQKSLEGDDDQKDQVVKRW